jgi:uroporphyrinogen decarboxylase
MNPRERVLASLRHQEPDRVPLDLGGTGDTGILMGPYLGLRKHLNLGLGTPRLCNVISCCASVEEDVRRSLVIDVVGIYYEPQEWREERFRSLQAPIEVPALWQPEQQADGSFIVSDSADNILYKMPADGYYFDPLYAPLAGVETAAELVMYLDIIENYDRPYYLDKTFEDLEQTAKDLYENTDYLLVGFFGGHIFAAALQLRGYENFLLDLLVNPVLAEDLMDRLAEGHMRRFNRFAETVGKYLHVIHLEDDLGMQDRTIISPDIYRQRIKPYHSKLYAHIKRRCDAYLMLHTDGSVYPLIPDFIEMGIDILNPVQYSARDMEAHKLKSEFGADLTFWGGGCDTQHVLPFHTPAQVKEEVRRRIDDLALGGGFVFCQVHNIQPGTPVENIVAMYEALEEYGAY